MFEIFLLLGLFQMKHFVADYPLQNRYMLGKMNMEGWKLPLFSHSLVHAAGTFAIVSFWNVNLAIVLSISDLILHFIVDRIKASPNIGGRFNPTQPYFWWALGLDQMAHHLINYLFIFIIVSNL